MKSASNRSVNALLPHSKNEVWDKMLPKPTFELHNFCQMCAIKTSKGATSMDAPMRIILLRDGDKCFVNDELRDARNEYTIGQLENEYYQWLDQLV